MLNENLLTPTERRIAALTNTIEAFKKYDMERKAYYAGLEDKLAREKAHIKKLEEKFEDSRRKRKLLEEEVGKMILDKDNYDNAEAVILRLISKVSYYKELVDLHRLEEKHDEDVDLSSVSFDELKKKYRELLCSRNTNRQMAKDLRSIVADLTRQLIVAKL